MGARERQDKEGPKSAGRSSGCRGQAFGETEEGQSILLHVWPEILKALGPETSRVLDTSCQQRGRYDGAPRRPDCSDHARWSAFIAQDLAAVQPASGRLRGRLGRQGPEGPQGQEKARGDAGRQDLA